MGEKRIGTIIEANAAKTIAAGAMSARLHAIIVHTALAGTCTIAGFLNAASTPAAANFVLPIGFVGTMTFGGITNDAGSLIITNSSATDNARVMVVWEPFA